MIRFHKKDIATRITLSDRPDVAKEVFLSSIFPNHIENFNQLSTSTRERLSGVDVEDLTASLEEVLDKKGEAFVLSSALALRAHGLYMAAVSRGAKAEFVKKDKGKSRRVASRIALQGNA